MSSVPTMFEKLGVVVGLMIVFVALVMFIAVLLTLPVMLLWNALMPDIFGLTEIGFWQSMGLLALCGCLFRQIPSLAKSKSDAK